MIGQFHSWRQAGRAPSPFGREPSQVHAAPAESSNARLGRAIEASHESLLRQQDTDGAWRYPLEGSNVLPDAYFLIAQRLLNLVSPQITQRLVERVRRQQLADGGWPLYPGPTGHPSITVEAYIALRMNGVAPQDPAMQRAREFLETHGGLSELCGFTRVTLAVLGLRPWSEIPFMPIEILLLPRSAPVSLHSFVTFTRIHMVSILALGELRYQIAGVPPEVAQELGGQEPSPSGPAGTILGQLGNGAEWTRRQFLPAVLHTRALQACKDYLIAHQEPDGTWGSYILSTLFSILSLQALGVAPAAPILRRGLDGLRSLLWQRDDEILAQPCNSTVWSTALVSYCLHETGLAATDPALRSAAHWLLQVSGRAERPRSDGTEGAQYAWGFQEGNTSCPDVDDTVAAIRAILPVVEATAPEGDAAHRCRLGKKWALAMQNDDGGWSSFDRNCHSWWLERIPFNDMHRAMTDPSTADMTGRMLEFLGVRGQRAGRGRSQVDAAVAWLRRDQCSDGSWFGRWGIAYIYGTWCALNGLAAVGIAPEDLAVRRGVAWLESRQNPDGGWGESWAQWANN
ncbi:MAG: prenyltransferase/squalene oxidase repeat-containing protein [Phycisphaerae bacterium]